MQISLSPGVAKPDFAKIETLADKLCMHIFLLNSGAEIESDGVYSIDQGFLNEGVRMPI